MSPVPASARFTAPLRARLTAWALRRQGQDRLPLKLTARRIYILPTAAGTTFALLLGVMFIAGMNYGNGLALLFTFWLTGFALVAMIQTHRVLGAVQVQAATAAPAHAGETVLLQLTVTGCNAMPDLHLAADGAAPATAASITPSPVAGPRSPDRLTLALPAPRRGRWRAPPLRLSTTAPFGLFEAWTWLTPQLTTLVYPAPAGNLRPPDTAAAQAGGLRAQAGHDELAWLRDFREGDSPRQVAWKAYARGQPLLVREYHGAGAHRHEFDFDALPGLDVEARLAQLTRWVLDASQAGAPWTLRLPALPPLTGSGIDHRDKCLRHLALHGAGGATR